MSFTRLMAPVALMISLAGCVSRQVESGLTQQDAQQIAVLLKDNGISAKIQLEHGKKEGNSWEVLVRGGADQAVEAWKVLHANGLPREKAKGLEEVYASAGMIPTAAEEKARLLVGLSGELSRTLKSIAGVVDARVHVVLPETNPLVDKSQQTPTTASVLLKYQGQQPPLKPEDLRSLVAKGIEGLTPENVSVVMNRVVVNPVQRGPIEIAQDSLVSIAAVILACITGFGALGLLGKNRWQKAKIADLERKLAELNGAPAALESAGRS
jgi:type III secretion protein J